MLTEGRWLFGLKDELLGDHRDLTHARLVLNHVTGKDSTSRDMKPLKAEDMEGSEDGRLLWETLKRRAAKATPIVLWTKPKFDMEKDPPSASLRAIGPGKNYYVHDAVERDGKKL